MAKFKDNQGTLDYANEMIEMFEREKKRTVNVNNMVKEMNTEDVKMEKVKIEMLDEHWDYD
jgi:16S rRNA G527 N7-methylase RsmG